jgi:hypothetical protein
MGYIGNQQTEGFSSIPAKQDLTGATGTSLTLSHAVASAEGIDLFINNVRQESGEAYSIAGDGVTVTLTGSVVAADDIYVVYNSLALQTSVVPDASVSTAKIIDGNVTAAKLANTLDLSAKALTMPSGSIIQVQHTQFTGATYFNTTANTWHAFSDLTVNITPTATNSKIMVQMFIGGWEHNNDNDHVVRFAFYRDSSLLAAPAAGSRWNAVGMGATNFDQGDRLSTPAVAWITYFDEPSSTSQITYKGAVNVGSTSGIITLNRTMQDTDSAGHERTVSSIVVTEIAG